MGTPDRDRCLCGCLHRNSYSHRNQFLDPLSIPGPHRTLWRNRHQSPRQCLHLDLGREYQQCPDIRGHLMTKGRCTIQRANLISFPTTLLVDGFGLRASLLLCPFLHRPTVFVQRFQVQFVYQIVLSMLVWSKRIHAQTALQGAIGTYVAFHNWHFATLFRLMRTAQGFCEMESPCSNSAQPPP